MRNCFRDTWYHRLQRAIGLHWKRHALIDQLDAIDVDRVLFWVAVILFAFVLWYPRSAHVSDVPVYPYWPASIKLALDQTGSLHIERRNGDVIELDQHEQEEMRRFFSGTQALDGWNRQVR